MRQLFILGNPRSGTSLFRVMLNHHPEILVPPESGYIQWWYSKYRNVTQTQLNDKLFRKNLIEDILSSKKIETWHIQKEQLEYCFNKLEPTNYSEVCQAVAICYSKSINKTPKILGDKNNYYINHLSELIDIFPEAKYIHIVRDGRDVACSYLDLHSNSSKSAYKPKLPNEIIDIAKEWSNNCSSIENFFQSIPENNHLAV